MKIRTKLVFSAIISLVLLWIGIAAITFVGRRSDRAKTVLLMEEYALNVKANLASFFGDAIDVATSLAAVQSDARLDWEGERGAGQLFSKIVALKDNSVHRVSLLDLEGHIYDAYKSGPVGNPWQGGRRTQDNNEPNSPAIVLADREYFRALVADNPRGEFKVMVSEPYIPRGLTDKYFITSASVIYDGQPAGVINVAQTTAELSHLYVTLASDFARNFGTKAWMCLVSDAGQLVSELRYNSARRDYEDTLFGTTDTVPVSSLGSEIESAIRESISASGVITTRLYGEEHFLASVKIEGTPLSVCLAAPCSTMLLASRIMLVAAIILFWAVTVAMSLGMHAIIRSVSKSIAQMDSTMQDLAEGGGDLTTRIEVVGDDEIATVSKNFNHFMATLHGMIDSVNESAEAMDGIGQKLVRSAAVISDDVSSIAKDIENLNFTVDEQSESVTEASATITQIARNIDSLTRQIEDQSLAVTESSASVQQMVSNIAAISDSISNASSTVGELKSTAANGRGSIDAVHELVDKLSSQSDSLLEANSVIDNIAAQTNLLAMNAAIEAAHAGEAGKGFSVVAEEIRKLAEDSASQSKTIAAGLKNTIASIKNIADATNTADGAFDAVVAKVDAIVSLANVLDTAMSEQNAGSRQVLETLKNIESVTARIRDGAVEMNDGTDVILKEMNRLSSVSQSVQDRSGSIAKAAEDINSFVTEIVGTSDTNKEVAGILVSITGKFRL